MRIGLAILLAAGLSIPAMAADVVVTTPAPGAEAHNLNQADKHENKADRAAENGNFGKAAKQENKADRSLDKADRDATGSVTVVPR